jgi:hypothetical protein
MIDYRIVFGILLSANDLPDDGSQHACYRLVLEQCVYGFIYGLFVCIQQQQQGHAA